MSPDRLPLNFFLMRSDIWISDNLDRHETTRLENSGIRIICKNDHWRHGPGRGATLAPTRKPPQLQSSLRSAPRCSVGPRRWYSLAAPL